MFAVLLQDHGLPLERIRDLMGHSELRVTESYAYVMPESLLQDMGAMDPDLESSEVGVRVRAVDDVEWPPPP